MELRFARRARATQDLDIGIAGTRASRLRILSEVLKVGFDQFTFRVKPHTRNVEQADTVSIQVAVEYKTRSWRTIEVDLEPAKGHADLVEPNVHGLAELGIPITSPSDARACRSGCTKAACL